MAHSIVEILSEAGHEVLTVNEQGLGGCADADLASICNSERRVLITLDTGFGDIRSFPPAQSVGIIILRPIRQDRSSVLVLVRRLIPRLPAEGINGKLWIVGPTTVRIRS